MEKQNYDFSQYYQEDETISSVPSTPPDRRHHRLQALRSARKEQEERERQQKRIQKRQLAWEDVVGKDYERPTNDYETMKRKASLYPTVVQGNAPPLPNKMDKREKVFKRTGGEKQTNRLSLQIRNHNSSERIRSKSFNEILRPFDRRENNVSESEEERK